MGGAPGNFAFHAAQAGAEAHVVSAVGDDVLGREALGLLSSWGVGIHHVAIDPTRPTGTVDVTLSTTGVPRYTIRDAVAWDAVPHSSKMIELAARADAAGYGTLGQRSAQTHETLRAFLAATRADCLRIFDVNLRSPDPDPALLTESIAVATIVKVSDEEWPATAAALDLPQDIDAGPAALRDRFGLPLVVLTRGPAGCRVIEASGTIDVPGVPAEVTDTVGAGDSFTASLVVGLLQGRPAAEAAAVANAVAAYVCTQPGGTPRWPKELAARFD